MNLFKLSVFIFFCTFITSTHAVKIETDQEKLSYSMGIFFGQTVIRQEMEIDIPAFMQAVEDVLSKSERKLSDDEMEETDGVLELIQQEIQQKKRTFKDFVILYRTNAQSRALEEGLRRKGIAYNKI